MRVHRPVEALGASRLAQSAGKEDVTGQGGLVPALVSLEPRPGGRRRPKTKQDQAGEGEGDARCVRGQPLGGPVMLFSNANILRCWPDGGLGAQMQGTYNSASTERLASLPSTQDEPLHPLCRSICLFSSSSSAVLCLQRQRAQSSASRAGIISAMTRRQISTALRNPQRTGHMSPPRGTRSGSDTPREQAVSQRLSPLCLVPFLCSVASRRLVSWRWDDHAHDGEATRSTDFSRRGWCCPGGSGALLSAASCSHHCPVLRTSRRTLDAGTSTRRWPLVQKAAVHS